MIKKKKVNRFYEKEGPNVEDIHYKNIELLMRFVTEQGKIRSRRETGACAKHQRMVAKAVKRARRSFPGVRSRELPVAGSQRRSSRRLSFRDGFRLPVPAVAEASPAPTQPRKQTHYYQSKTTNPLPFLKSLCLFMYPTRKSNFLYSFNVILNILSAAGLQSIILPFFLINWLR